MRLCVIGNSHVGSLKRAWDAAEDTGARPEGVSLRFFASRHRGLEDGAVEDGRFVPRTPALRRDLAFTSGGAEEIELAAYDAFLVYGCFVAPYRDAGGFYSQACRAQALEDHFRPRMGVRLAQALRAALPARVPVLIGHNPLPCDPAVEARLDPGPATGEDHYTRALAMVNARFFAPEGLALVAQPAATRLGARPFFTAAHFAKGSRRLEVGDALDGAEHGAADRVHMNDAFGALYLAALCESLAGPAQLPAAGQVS